MPVRPRPAVRPGAALLLAVTLVLTGLLEQATGATEPVSARPSVGSVGSVGVDPAAPAPVATDGAPPVAAPAPAPDRLVRIRCVWATVRHGHTTR